MQQHRVAMNVAAIAAVLVAARTHRAACRSTGTRRFLRPRRSRRRRLHLRRVQHFRAPIYG